MKQRESECQSSLSLKQRCLQFDKAALLLSGIVLSFDKPLKRLGFSLGAGHPAEAAANAKQFDRRGSHATSHNETTGLVNRFR